MGAGAAVWAAAEHPTAVQSLVLEGPFVRDAKVGCFAALALSLALKRPWGPASWKMVRVCFGRLGYQWTSVVGALPTPFPGDSCHALVCVFHFIVICWLVCVGGLHMSPGASATPQNRADVQSRAAP